MTPQEDKGEAGVGEAPTHRVAIDPHAVVDGPGAVGHVAQATEDVTVPLPLWREPCGRHLRQQGRPGGSPQAPRPRATGRGPSLLENHPLGGWESRGTALPPSGSATEW